MIWTLIWNLVYGCFWTTCKPAIKNFILKTWSSKWLKRKNPQSRQESDWFFIIDFLISDFSQLMIRDMLNGISIDLHQNKTSQSLSQLTQDYKIFEKKLFSRNCLVLCLVQILNFVILFCISQLNFDSIGIRDINTEYRIFDYSVNSPNIRIPNYSFF
jgi:cytochrome bd-type quinol oxidase subunit 2